MNEQEGMLHPTLHEQAARIAGGLRMSSVVLYGYTGKKENSYAKHVIK